MPLSASQIRTALANMLAKNLLGIGGRAADKLEHLSSRMLLFSYCVQLVGKGLNLSLTPGGAYRAPALGY